MGQKRTGKKIEKLQKAAPAMAAANQAVLDSFETDERKEDVKRKEENEAVLKEFREKSQEALDKYPMGTVGMEQNFERTSLIPPGEEESLLRKIDYTVFRRFYDDFSKKYQAVFPVYQTESQEENQAESQRKIHVRPYRISYENQVRSCSIARIVIDAREKTEEKLKSLYNVLYERDCTIGILIQRKVEGAFFHVLLKHEDGEDAGLHSTSSREAFVNAWQGYFPGSIISDQEEKPGDYPLLTLPPHWTDSEESFTPAKIHEAVLAEKKCERHTAGRMDEVFLDCQAIAAVTGIPSEKAQPSEKWAGQGIETLLDGITPKDEKEEYSILLLAVPVRSEGIRNIKNMLEQYATFLAPFANRQKTVSKTDTIGTSDAVNAQESRAFSQTQSTTLGVNSTVTKTNYGGIPVGVSKKVGANIGKSTAVGLTVSESRAFSQGETTSFCTGRSLGQSLSSADTAGETIQFTSYPVKNLLAKLEKQIERLQECEGSGMWQQASYFLAQDPSVCFQAAQLFHGLMLGKDSYIENHGIAHWTSGESEKNKAFYAIQAHLLNLSHPVFFCQEAKEVYPRETTFTTFLSGWEMAKLPAFPKASVPGLPVLACAAFGRSVEHRDYGGSGDSVRLGKIYHMMQKDAGDVRLKKDSLTAHTFITGSTGAGKSTTVCRLLREAKVPFLVIEPAKGEYRHEFPDAAIYSTNPKQGQLLQLNPFWFPPEIHVLEHMDRLVEIFNACWPMYAAMPAVLKEAIEESYRGAGWDLVRSTNWYDDIYPDFSDVLRNIRKVMNQSEFSADNKGDYTGALVTRVRSLTNGINGQIFSSCGLSNEELFEKKVIVDLSRVGSVETKSLIMGLLVLQLQEYRMAENKGRNLGLRHLTVLEEAHHLLRRTSFEQASEGANLQGKSVEMLTNAIAEMRTYGEGFVIADQSPGLLDMAAIRNTNTKILHRLPDLSDRELVGHSAALSEEQIEELARLGTGVAAVYQDNWVQPVLCKVPYRAKDEPDGENRETNASSKRPSTDFLRDLAEKIPFVLLAPHKDPASYAAICEYLPALPISGECKRLLKDAFGNPSRRLSALAAYYHVDEAFKAVPQAGTPQQKKNALLSHLRPSLARDAAGDTNSP